MNKTALLIFCITLFYSGLQNSTAQEKKIQFGIYETVSLKDLKPYSENLSKFIVKQELDMDSPVLGYVNINNVALFDSLFTEESTPKMNLMLTRPKPGPNGNSYAIIALKEVAFIDISDISNTIPYEGSVEVRFNFSGTQKWADMTLANTGKIIAFAINNEIWSLPMVKSEIRSGLALIDGIEDEKTSREISELLNSAKKK